jgi:hypothetical protein
MPEKQPYLPPRPFTQHELTLVHDLAQAHAGTMEMLPLDPEAYPYQGQYRYDNDPKPQSVVDGIATMLHPKAYPRLQEELRDRFAPQVHYIGELLTNKQNVALSMPHGPMTDIGVGFAAVTGAVRELGCEFKTDFVVSFNIQFMGIKLGENALPAVDALGLLCDRIHFSIPRSERVKRSALTQHVSDRKINASNKAMRDDMDREFEEGGVLVALAPSGTTDQKLRDGNYHMGKLGDGTAKLLTTPSLFVQPVAMHLPEVFETVGIARQLETADDVHDMMQEKVATLNRHGQRYVYDDPRIKT